MQSSDAAHAVLRDVARGQRREGIGLAGAGTGLDEGQVLGQGPGEVERCGGVHVGSGLAAASASAPGVAA